MLLFIALEDKVSERRERITYRKNIMKDIVIAAMGVAVVFLVYYIFGFIMGLFGS